MDRAALIAELQQAGIKHSPEEILQIARRPDGRVVFLETGNERSGWQHIRDDHTSDFRDRGIPEERIQDAVMAAVTRGRTLGTQGVSRTIFEVEFNGDIQYISVSVSSNGYIVGANPTRRDLVRRLLQERD